MFGLLETKYTKGRNGGFKLLATLWLNRTKFLIWWSLCAYSNPKVTLETLQHLLRKATSARRPNGRHVPRQNQIRLDPHQAITLVAAYRDGKSIKELAQRYGVHRTTVDSLLRRFDVELRQRGLAANEVTAAARLYEQGWSLARLGSKYGVDPSTVWRSLLAVGVIMRSPHERRGF
jgi:lambda repressor-like predicted transcriptional regulator